MLLADVSRPEPGDYPLEDFTRSLGGAAPADHLVAAVQLGPELLANAGFDRLTGTLSMTWSSASSVAGTFTLTTSAAARPGEVLDVTGTFRATHK